MKTRRRFKQQITLQDRLVAWANMVRKQADLLAPGVERDALITKARQADIASHLDQWANSTALQPPQ